VTHATTKGEPWGGWVVTAVILFAAIAYGHALHLPFIGDDYVFLAKTRNASFLDLWSFQNVDFGWYRPWSRELHFWVLQKLVGAHEAGFRFASLLLWLMALGLYGVVAQRVAGRRVATLAILGAASLSLWGAPLMWISGTHDLWMLVFAGTTLWLVDRGQVRLALASYLAALLSKETAATLPIILIAHARWIEHRDWRAAARRALPFALMTVVWGVVHPALLHRLTHPADLVVNGDPPLPALAVARQSLLSLVNADKLLLPPDPASWRPLATLFSAVALALGAFLALNQRPAEACPGTMRASRADTMKFGAAWCAAGWLPLFLPSISWHAYYGGLGVLGAWLAIATLIENQRPWVLAGSLLALGLLRGEAASTRSWDWGSEWYQTRAGNMLNTIRTQLTALHPTLPQHSRLYFGNIPNNIGLIAGHSPAVRVWYDDPTLEAGFYSYYRPRAPGQADGEDLFFHFDSTTGIREVDGVPAARTPIDASPPTWVDDQEALGMLFVTKRDFPRAAALFHRLAALRSTPESYMYAGVCWQVLGDSLRAHADFDSAARLTRGTPAEIRGWAERLRATMP